MPNQWMSADRCSPDGRAGTFRKTGSSTCPPEGYIKRVTCPSRQQFYKDLQQQEQTRAEGPRKVYHAASKYKCPRARDTEVTSSEVRATDARGRPKKKPAGREEGDTKYEEERKKLNYVAENEHFRPPQKHRKGVGNLDSIQYSALTNYTLPPPPVTIDEAVQAYCKEATKNIALYTTQSREEAKEKIDRVRDAGMKVARPVEICKAKSSTSKRFDGLSEHLKYGVFRRRNSQGCEEPMSSRHVFGPAQPPKIGLDRRTQPDNFDLGVANDASRVPGRSHVAPRLQPRLVVSNTLHVDIKPRQAGYFSPPRHRNAKWPGRPLRARSFNLSPAFSHPVYPRMLQPAPINYRASAAIMRMPSNYPQNSFMPYGQMSRCPSKYCNYNRQYMNESRKKMSPHRNTSRHSGILDKQLTSPYSRSRSSQSPGAFMRTRMSYAPQVTETRTNLPTIMRKKSQHSITSSVRFQQNLTTCPKKASSINRNFGMSKRMVESRSQFLRRVLSVPSKRERTIPESVMQRQPMYTYISPRDKAANQNLSAMLPSQSPPSPKPSQSSQFRRRTYSLCLTPTVTRKILSGEVVQPAVNTPKVTSGVETQPKKSASTSLNATPTPEHRIACISTQTLIL